MKKIFKILSVILVFATATQSFGMSRLSKLAARPVLRSFNGVGAPVHRALVRVALKPTTINPRLVSTSTSNLRTATPVASTQARTVSTSAPIKIQNSQQEQSHNQNAFKSERARFALGGFASLSGVGLILSNEPEKAQSSDSKKKKYFVRLGFLMRRESDLKFAIALVDKKLASLKELKEALSREKSTLKKIALLFKTDYSILLSEELKNDNRFAVEEIQRLIKRDMLELKAKQESLLENLKEVQQELP